MTTTAREIELPLEEHAVVVRGGLKIVFNSTGIVVTRNDALVCVASNNEPQVGDKQEDGTVFAGISPVTRHPMYAIPNPTFLPTNWSEAMDRVSQFEGNGHPAGTFRVPTKEELNVLFNNRVKIGAFDKRKAPSWQNTRYWSSTQPPGQSWLAWGQSFDDGECFRDYTANKQCWVCLVRD